MIYENKKYNSDDKNEKKYWVLVEEEIEKMRMRLRMENKPKTSSKK